MSDVFPKDGIQISYVTGEFIDDVLGGIDKIKGMTTAQVCRDIIMPLTLDAKMSYCELLRRRGRENLVIPHAEAFISHAHGYLFEDFLSAIKWLLREEPNTYVWIDLFAINQHEPMEWTFDWLSTTFKSAIQTMGRTIMVMSPWDNPLPFTRSWCVFEAYSTAVSNSKFQIALSKTDETQFLQDIVVDTNKKMKELLATIRAEKSECSVESDKKSIFAVIHATVGFSSLDAMVFERYREWVLEVSLAALLEQEQDTTDATTITETQTLGSSTLNSHNHNDASTMVDDDMSDTDGYVRGLLAAIGELYCSQGKYTKGELYIRRFVESCEEEFGEYDETTLMATQRLAVALSSQGRHTEANELLQSSISKQMAILGEDHKDTLQSKFFLATIYQSQGMHHEAEELFEACFDKQKQVLGSDHLDTLSTMSHLALTMQAQGKHSKAEILLKTCLESRKSILGHDHPDTLETVSNLALVFYDQENYMAAEDLNTFCLERRQAIMGSDHPDTLESLCSLANVCYASDVVDYPRAEAMYQSCLQGRWKVLGKTHPVTLDTVFKLAETFHAQDKCQQAKQQYEICLQGRKSVLGNTHLDTLKTMGRLALTLEVLEEHMQAKKIIFQCCLEGLPKISNRQYEIYTSTDVDYLDDPNDPIQSLMYFALLLDKQEKYSEAEEILQICLEERKSDDRSGTHRQFQTMAASYHLAGTLHNQDMLPQAEELYQTCLKSFGLGVDKIRTMACLALTLEAQEKHEEAVEMLDLCLEHRIDVMNSSAISASHPFRSEGDYGNLRWDVVFDTEIFDLERREEIVDQLEEVVLALKTDTKAQLARAETIYEICLEERRDIFGFLELPKTLLTMHRLAKTCQDQGKHFQAAEIYKQCLEGRRAILGNSHLDTVATMNGLGDVLIQREKYSEAQVILESCLREQNFLLGSFHLDTMITVGKLAFLLNKQGKYERSLDLLEPHLVDCKNMLGDDHQETLRMACLLAETLVSLNEYGRAERLYSDCLEVQKVMLGRLSPETWKTMDGLAALFVKQQQYTRARTLYEDCLTFRTAQLGALHVDTLTNMHSLGTVLTLEGFNFPRAVTTFKKCWESRQEVLGADHVDTLTVYSDYGTSLAQDGRLEEAQKTLSECLQQQQAHLGMDHHQTLTTIYVLGKVVWDLGLRLMAENHLTECLKHQKRTLGNTHPKTLETKAALVAMLTEQEKFTALERLYDDA